MSAIDVLARALYDQSGGHQNNSWDTLNPGLRDGWVLQAEVIAARMIEAEPGPALVPDWTDDPDLTPGPLLVEAAHAAHDDIRADELGWEEAVRLLAQIRDALSLIQNVEANLVRHIYLTGEHGDQELDGLGIVKITRGRDRTKWDERGVAQAVIDQRMTARAGEMPDDPWEVAEWLLEVFGVSYCRVTPLRAMGLEPDAFCESSPGKVSVQFASRR